jgi:DUF177 domain-containing protein
METDMTSRGTFIAQVHDLDVLGRDVAFAVTPAWMRGALEGCEMQPAGPEGSARMHLSKTGNDVLVRGKLDVELVVPCARCLEPVRLHPVIELSLLLQQAPTTLPSGASRPGSRERTEKGAKARGGHGSEATEEPELSAEDADFDTYEGEEVVLDRFFREAILLESPIFPLCSEACEGIRPAQAGDPSPTQGGSNVNDPRFLPLLELAKRRPTKE